MNNQCVADNNYMWLHKDFCYFDEEPNKINSNHNLFFLNLILFLCLIDNVFLLKHAHDLVIPILKNFFGTNENSEIEKETENKEEENIIVAPKPYEDKYLEEVEKLADDIVFTELELEKELQQRVIIRKNMENKLMFDKTHLETQLTYFEKKLEKLELEKEIKVTEKDEYDEDFEEGEETEEEKRERIEYAIAAIQNDQKLCKKAKEILDATTVEQELVNKFAREFILKERLDNLKNCIIMEKTPIGNVIMFYNNSKSSFEYYSDSTVPYRYLEVVARKYILTYKCKQIYIDMEQEIKEAEKKLEEKKKKDEEEKQRQQEEKDNVKNSTSDKSTKNVFAKFKNYNKDNSIKVAAVPLDRPATTKQTKPQEEKIIKERANRYSFEGKIANFNFLKKIDRKTVDKRYAVSFSEFKKMQKTS